MMKLQLSNVETLTFDLRTLQYRSKSPHTRDVKASKMAGHWDRQLLFSEATLWVVYQNRLRGHTWKSGQIMRYQTCRSIAKKMSKATNLTGHPECFLFWFECFFLYTHFRHSTRSSSVGPIFIFLQVITKVIPHSDPLRAPDEEMLGSQSRNGGGRGDSRHTYTCHCDAC